jgi:hypothetical protein
MLNEFELVTDPAEAVFHVTATRAYEPPEISDAPVVPGSAECNETKPQPVVDRAWFASVVLMRAIAHAP